MVHVAYPLSFYSWSILEIQDLCLSVFRLLRWDGGISSLRPDLDLDFRSNNAARKPPRIRISAVGVVVVSEKNDLNSHTKATTAIILRRVPFLNI
jgi:hypothetical protein